MTEHDILLDLIVKTLSKAPKDVVMYFPADPDSPPRFFTGNPPRDRDGNYLVYREAT